MIFLALSTVRSKVRRLLPHSPKEVLQRMKVHHIEEYTRKRKDGESPGETEEAEREAPAHQDQVGTCYRTTQPIWLARI